METKRVLAPLGLCLVGWGSLKGIFKDYHSRPLSQVPLQVSWSPSGHWKSSKVTLDPSLLHCEQSQLSIWHKLCLCDPLWSLILKSVHRWMIRSPLSVKKKPQHYFFSFSFQKLVLQFNPDTFNEFISGFLKDLDWLLANTKYLEATDF